MSDTTNVKSPKEKYKCEISDFDVIKFLLDVLDEEHLRLKEEIIKTLKNEYGFDYQHYQRRNIEIVYLVYAHHSNYIFFKNELNEAMNFAKQENGALGRIMQSENGKKFIDWYDFNCLCWSDDV